MRRGRAWKKRARRTATASLPLWARIPRFYIWNNELERAKDAICERPLNLYVCRRGALWLAYHRTQTQSATQWECLFNPSTDIDSYYSYDTRTRQKCFICTGYSFQPSIRLNSSEKLCNKWYNWTLSLKCVSCLNVCKTFEVCSCHGINRKKITVTLNIKILTVFFKILQKWE